jgi:hypothetical protein
MLSSPPTDCPTATGGLFEPTGDGFRTLGWRDGDRLTPQRRDKKPMIAIAHREAMLLGTAAIESRLSHAVLTILA